MSNKETNVSKSKYCLPESVCNTCCQRFSFVNEGFFHEVLPEAFTHPKDQKKVPSLSFCFAPISIALRPSRPASKPALTCFVLISMFSRHWSSRLAQSSEGSVNVAWVVLHRNRRIGARERRDLIPHVRFRFHFWGRKGNWNQASHVRASSVLDVKGQLAFPDTLNARKMFHYKLPKTWIENHNLIIIKTYKINF